MKTVTVFCYVIRYILGSIITIHMQSEYVTEKLKAVNPF